ncbi:hypothetical protein CMETHOX_33540 [Lacrimispora indolis]|nr:hypothetical protein CMETHOX_33540 [[Clostridium] methoxybenzovorans]
MEVKLNKNVCLKVVSLLLCFYLGVVPFFQPKKVRAVIGVDDAILATIGVVSTALFASGYIQRTVFSQEDLNKINAEVTTNLQSAFPDPKDYDEQLNIFQNINHKLLNGEEVDWSKYSGKALYAVLKGVVDVVWPSENLPDQIIGDVWCYLPDGTYITYLYQQQPKNIRPKNPVLYYETATEISYHIGQVKDYVGSNTNLIWSFYHKGGANEAISFYGYTYPDDYVQFAPGMRSKTDNNIMFFANLFSGSMNSRYVPNMTAKTANKVKLPTRLPQTVINNINNYIDNSTENLIINPTPEELPQLPEGYNPVTDDLPNLPGYQDVVPDQEPTTAPEPTPTPPDPTPTPPEYDGSGWVNPIGNFLAGLLEFLKTAFVPTQSLDFSPLQNMESGTFGAKFPFSLPSDFGKILGVIQADPITPKFDASIPLSKVGYQDIPMEIDLEPYSNIAGICKSGFVILFCIGLFFLTRRFMSPGG